MIPNRARWGSGGALRGRRRDEQGYLTLEYVIWSVVLMSVAAAVITVLASVFLHPGHPARLVIGLVAAGAVVPAALVLVAGMRRFEDWDYERRSRLNDQTRTQMGPKIEEWLGNPPRGAQWDDLEAWRKAERSGLSIEEAQHWSDRGISYRTAAAARRHGISPDQVMVIAQALRDGGLGNETDRKFYDECVTHPTPDDGWTAPAVLHRWIKFTPAAITTATAARLRLPDVEAVAARDARRDYGPGMAAFRRRMYARDVLTILEKPGSWPRIQQQAARDAERYEQQQ